MRRAGKAILLTLIVSSSASAQEQPRDLTSSPSASSAVLTCLPQDHGFPRQKFFIKQVDGKNTRGWRAMATSVRIDAVPHKIEVMYYHIGNTRYMTFDFKPEPGGEYQCIGNTDNGATLQIKNTKTGEVLIKKEPEGGCWGAWCVN